VGGGRPASVLAERPALPVQSLPVPHRFPPPGLRWLLAVATLVLVSAVLHVARPILSPIALAVLLTFLLSPVVSALERRGLGRATSVLVVVLLAFGALGAAGYALAAQTEGLIGSLPRYEIRHQEEDQPRAGHRAHGGPMPVVIRGVEPSLGEQMGQWVEPLATIGLVIVLVIFMLASRRRVTSARACGRASRRRGSSSGDSARRTASRTPGTR
jgi:predicted PurR-regulated permease PerM